MTTELTIKTDGDVTFQSIKSQVEQFVVLNKNMVFDYEDKQGEKEAKSHVAKLRKLKKPVADKHKEEKAEALATGRRLDAQKKEIITLIDGMISHHAEPLQAIDDRRKKEAEEKRVAAEIEACWDEAHLANKTFDQDKEIAALKAKEEAEREEKERLEREENIRKDAGEKAKLQERERIKREQEQKEAKAKRKCEQKEAERKRKEQDTENRKKVNRAALAALGKHVPEDTALLILGDIIKGDVPHVSISYS